MSQESYLDHTRRIDREARLKTLRIMCNIAKNTHCVIRTRYHDVWFWPHELRAANKRGEFVLHEKEFELVPTWKRREQLQAAIRKARRALNEFDIEMDTLWRKE